MRARGSSRSTVVEETESKRGVGVVGVAGVVIGVVGVVAVVVVGGVGMSAVGDRFLGEGAHGKLRQRGHGRGVAEEGRVRCGGRCRRRLLSFQGAQ